MTSDRATELRVLLTVGRPLQ